MYNDLREGKNYGILNLEKAETKEGIEWVFLMSYWQIKF